MHVFLEKGHVQLDDVTILESESGSVRIMVRARVRVSVRVRVN